MSTSITAEPQAQAAEPRKPLPAEVNQLLGAGWMAYGFAALMLVVLWPAITGSWPSGISHFLLFAIVAGGAVVGCFVSYKVSKADPSIIAIGKWSLVLGLVGGLVFLVIVLIAKFQEPAGPTVMGVASPHFFGPSPILSSSLIAIGAILPIFFALMALSMINRQEIRDHFFPPEPEEVQTLETEPVVVERDEVEAMLEDHEAALAEAADEVEVAEEEVAVAEEDKGKPHVPGDIDEPLAMGDLELFADEEKTDPEKTD